MMWGEAAEYMVASFFLTTGKKKLFKSLLKRF